MIRIIVTIGLLVAAVLFFYTGLERLICRSLLRAGGLAVTAVVDGVRRAECLDYPEYGSSFVPMLRHECERRKSWTTNDGQMPQMWILDVDIGWRSRCHGSPDFHVQRSGGLESLPDPETGASKGTFIRSVRTVERAPLPCPVDRRGISRIATSSATPTTLQWRMSTLKANRADAQRRSS